MSIHILEGLKKVTGVVEFVTKNLPAAGSNTRNDLENVKIRRGIHNKDCSCGCKIFLIKRVMISLYCSEAIVCITNVVVYIYSY